MHRQQPPLVQDRAPEPRRRLTGRAAQILGLLALSGIGAELLAAYSDSTGDPGAIAFALVFFGALYGAPALLARDLARRLGWGWPSLLVMFAALGVVQACLIDQSLFAADYGGYTGWAENREPTLIPALGFSGYNAYSFLIGHVIFSFAAPVALAEAWSPRRARTPWLGRIGTILAGLAYLGAAALIVSDPESQSGSVPQLLGACGVVGALVIVAAVVGRRARAAASEPSAARGEIPLWAIVLTAVVAAVVPDLVPPTWPGVAGAVAVSAGFGIALLLAARRRRWSIRHAAAVAVGFLLARGLLAFTYFPLSGEVSPAAKYTHNAVMLLVVLFAGAVALRRHPRSPESIRGTGVASSDP
ncbi:hypothetical protein [Brachybacterium fresconis]|uniref:Peptidoglycan/LPS O-acetylase OafA/YrhL n=1 Tax=Brachybacterium fresconis TaxID=173363 RepID=A0ABS4YMZ2_9MICO|nr:hypothetical protein [Brachybacterium fresconis]MBP2410123.1 peptidoglycan/LPS O-acetylase OafA/YrhL [Brachybacterium fresconis]